MSGIEVAGLALGVLPIFLEIVKSYKATAERLNTLRYYVQAAYDLRLQYRIEGSSFRNECQHLLAIIIDDASDLSDMLRDTNHSLWLDHMAEKRLRQLLDQDYELCEEMVVKIRDVLRETEDELSYLSETENMKVCIIIKALLCTALLIQSLPSTSGYSSKRQILPGIQNFRQRKQAQKTS